MTLEFYDIRNYKIGQGKLDVVGSGHTIRLDEKQKPKNFYNFEIKFGGEKSVSIEK
jgi:hypothetical protein